MTTFTGESTSARWGVRPALRALNVHRAGVAVALFAAGSCQAAARIGLPGAPAVPASAPSAPSAAAAPAPASVAKAAPSPAAAAPIEKPAVLNTPPAEKKLHLRLHSAKARIKRTPGPYEVDDVVLAHRYYEGGKRPVKDWHAGTVLKVEGDEITIKFFSDDDAQKLPASFVKVFDWKPQGVISCGEGYGVRSGKVVEAPTGEEVRVAYKNPEEEKTFPMVACRGPAHWHDMLSEVFTERAKYIELKAPPKAVSEEPSSKQVAGALSYKLAYADGGAYLRIQKCYVTSTWASLSVGSRHTGRRAAAQCVVGIPERDALDEPKPLEACLVMAGACEQKYLGGTRYAGCVWEGSTADYKTIDCSLVK